LQVTSSHQQQQFLYLAITIVILALAVSLVRWQEHGQKEIANQIDTHRLIIYESSKIKQELAQIYFQATYRTFASEPGVEDSLASQQNLYGTRFNLSVSLYTLQSQLDTLIRLLEKVGPQDRLIKKLKLQLRQFQDMEPLFRSDDKKNTDKTYLSLKGIALTIEQVEGLQNLEYKQLTEKLGVITRRDNRILIGFLVTLVLLSYLLIRWASNRIKTTQDRFTAELEDKNAELERFVYTVSHDLRTPLVSIKGFVGLLQKDIASNDIEKVLADVKRINQAADLMAELLEGLLELSRIGRVINPPMSGSLTRLVSKAVEPLQDKIEQRGITIVIKQNMPVFWGDQLRLSEVFQNLVENAVKFMGDQPAPRIEVSARVDNDMLVCAVKDNGIGIDPQYHDRVFNLFERLNPEIDGTGIGMPLAKRIIEAHGGTIEIESEGAQTGCTIIFTLPVQPDNEA
jgi:signal transduction histidine kinase